MNDKEKQKALLIEIIQEDEKNGMYEESQEERIKVYSENGNLFIKPSELFASKKVQNLIKRIASINVTRK